MTDEQGTGVEDRAALRAVLRESDAPLARLERLAARLLGLPLVRVTEAAALRAGDQPAAAPPDLARLLHAPAFAAALARETLDRGQPQMVENARCHPLWRDSPAVRTGQVQAYAALPLFGADGVPLGTLCALDPAPRPWTPADLATLDDLAALAVPLLSAAPVAPPARRPALHEIVCRALDFPAAPLIAAGTCAAELVCALSVPCAAVWLRDAAGEGWSATARAGLDAIDAQNYTVEQPERPLRVGALVAAAHPYLTTTLATDPYLTDPAWVATQGLTTFAGVPLRADGQVLGLLGVFAREPLPPDILSELDIVAATLAQGIARARAEAALTTRAAEVQRDLRLQNAELETRMIERTLQLEAVISTLRQEIAGREEVESALRQSEERYRTLIELAPDIIYSVSAADGTILTVNPAFEKLSGWNPADWLGRSFLDLVHEDDLPIAHQTFSLITGGGTPAPYQLRMLCQSGEYRVGEFTTAPRTAGGRVVEVFGIGRDVTERQQVLDALRESEERFHSLSDLVLEGLGIHENGIIVETNLSLERMLGYTPGELLGRSVLELAAPEERTHAFTKAISHSPQDYELRMLRKDGTTFPAEIHSRMAPYQGRMLRAVSVRDITERTQAEEALRRQNEELAALHETTLGLINQLDPNQLLEAIIVRAAALIGTAHGYLYVVEPDQQTMVVRLGIGAFAQQIGYRVAWGEGLSGQVWATGAPLAVDDYNSWTGHLPDREPLGMYAIVGIPLRSGSEVVGVIGLAFVEPGRTIGSTEIALLNRFAQLASLALENARLYAAAQQEVTDRKRAEESMAHLALHDALTGLPNRTLLHERLRQAILEARRTGHTLALLVMDMDRFKEVNDTLGHYYGDVLLRQVGVRLREGLRASDTVARLGGDEFAVLLPGSDQEGAHLAARKLLALLEYPFELEGHALDVRISIGIALYPDHGSDAETLLRRADVAMYVAKRGGTGYAMYTTEQDPYSPSRLALIGDLRRAIEQEELVLYYQPKLSYRTGRVTGVEALVRWPHSVHGTLNPDQFIPLAEHMGLIKSLSHCVLNIALRQCRAWYDAGWDLPVAVNLSLRDLHDTRLPEQIGHLLEIWALPPSLLHIEITEDAAMSDPARTLGVLTWLRGLGVHLAIDDFGTGQSSLAQLRRLPVDQLKIDKSFVREMAVNDNDAVIVRTIIDLGHNLGLTVVAEGVEDAATAALLTRLGCDEGQGFYLSRAVPPAALLHWLTAQGVAPPTAESVPDLEAFH